MRPLCSVCKKNYCAPNYYRDGVRHYRSKCSECIRKKRDVKLPNPRWKSAGYTKKAQCDQCKFKSAYTSQMTVWHINGELNDTSLTNLRTICLNCVEVVKRRYFTWMPGDLELDA
jgi:hypothetical protein